ncbi:hypothetical protein BGX26_004892 [Mortierella sp. AD094]|nr:hypothetical protein BGX26_004892 [Mortierella sp. AD094]
MSSLIVIFKDGTPHEEIESAAQDIESSGGTISQRYTSALLGFSAVLPEGYVSALNGNPHVDYIEPDGEVTTQ